MVYKELRYNTIGEDEVGHVLRGEVVDEVLHAGEAGISVGQDAESVSASVFTLRIAFGNLSRSVWLAAHADGPAENVRRCAHDLGFGSACKACAAARGRGCVVVVQSNGNHEGQ